jgi:hypothetical protein
MERFERTLLAVHGPEPAPAEEWSRYVMESNAVDLAGVLVVVDLRYPGPTAVQRAQANSAAKARGKFPPIAVVIGSVMHRGIVTVFSWMQNNNIVPYSPYMLSAAMDYAGIAAKSHGIALSRVHEMARRVGSAWITSSVSF